MQTARRLVKDPGMAKTRKKQFAGVPTLTCYPQAEHHPSTSQGCVELAREEEDARGRSSS